MEILQAQHRIVRHTTNLMKAIEDAARTCYLSEPSHQTTAEFLERLMRQGHHTPFEFADIEIEFICDRGVSHELVRHRLCSPMQESTRYCNYSKNKKHGLNVIDPMFFDSREPRAEYETHATVIGGSLCREEELVRQLNRFDVWYLCMSYAEWGYNTLLEMGASPQEARSVLPQSLKTKLKMKANVREWIHIFRLRAVNRSAHPQMREVMIPALKDCAMRWPVLFGGLVTEIQGDA